MSKIDLDEWYDRFEESSPQQKHGLLTQLISHPIPLDDAKDMDLGGIALDVYESLVNNNLIESALNFAHTFQKQQSELYDCEFQYFDDFLIEYSLFQGELDAVEEHLFRFKAQPDAAIDILLRILDSIKLYGATDIANDLCKAAYQPVKKSSQVIEGTEDEFGVVITWDLVERAYQQLQQGKDVDWEQLGTDAEAYGFTNTPQNRQEIEEALTEPLLTGTAIGPLFKEERSCAIRKLGLGFSRYMSDDYQMSFVCSQSIWATILEFKAFQSRQRRGTHPDRYFSFQHQTLDQFLGEAMFNLFAMRKALGTAMIWGIPYVYEFLTEQQIIEPSTGEAAIASSTSLKKLLIEKFDNSLWRYSFVRCWHPCKSISPEVYALEAEKFKDSFEKSKPLSDEVSQGGPMGLLPQLFKNGIKDSNRHSLPAKTQARPSLSPSGQKSSKNKKKKSSGKGFGSP